MAARYSRMALFSFCMCGHCRSRSASISLHNSSLGISEARSITSRINLSTESSNSCGRGSTYSGSLEATMRRRALGGHIGVSDRRPAPRFRSGPWSGAYPRGAAGPRQGLPCNPKRTQCARRPRDRPSERHDRHEKGQWACGQDDCVRANDPCAGTGGGGGSTGGGGIGEVGGSGRRAARRQGRPVSARLDRRRRAHIRASRRPAG